jgi:hypothetical protein
MSLDEDLGRTTQGGGAKLQGPIRGLKPALSFRLKAEL